MTAKRVTRCESRDRVNTATTAKKTDKALRPQPVPPAEPDAEPSRLDELERKFWDAQEQQLPLSAVTLDDLPATPPEPRTLDELQEDFEERQDDEFIWDNEKKRMVPRRVRRLKRGKEQLALPGVEASELDQAEDRWLRHQRSER
jgi:hypothetical protein